ncbi:hypothetical protein [Actinomadura opuntiae]|uniref:hypothetical protein n=1 Tax=Actinomadura sp. OS1-43 TaxID=604315 RepID=UPI00255A85A4|nr:hypothetical protein [Actinomadura sp. OS1-43]MDL4815978.1 hypothetical protein [Actinomadura sp. OS1-43]
MVLLAGAVLLVLISLAAWVALSRADGSPHTDVRLSSAPEDTRTAPAAQGPAEACQHHVVQALSHYVQETRQGGDSSLAVSNAMQQLDTIEFQVFGGVLNTFLEADEVGRRFGIAAQIQTVMPGIKRGCSQAY